ncbi:MAG TPA: ABC transporter ATP-binding protein [Thermomicrobiales bacterium]|nr:ABC transporter ATP-binding protein [Thermomicrobiales bacterium]
MSTEQAQPLLDVRNLTITYKTDRGFVAAVRDVSFTVPKGGSIGLVGESGSGKSTIAMAVMRLLPANARVTGEIIFDGTDLTKVNDRQLNQRWRWRKLSMVFQKSLSALSPVHRIGDQMHDVLRQHNPSMRESERREKINSVLEAVHLPSRVIRAYPFELSGGQMQRAMIALGLICDPPFVIFDEATTALDVITQSQILEEVKRLKEEYDLTTMVISHDVGVINATSDTVAVLYGGQLMEVAPRQTFFRAPQHPYSKALIDSIPTLRGPKKRITGISGWRLTHDDPSAGSQLSAARPGEGEVSPTRSPMIEVAPGHLVRRYEGIAGNEVQP